MRGLPVKRNSALQISVRVKHKRVGTHRHTGTQAHRHTGTQAHRHTGTQTHRHTDTQTHRHTHLSVSIPLYQTDMSTVAYPQTSRKHHLSFSVPVKQESKVGGRDCRDQKVRERGEGQRACGSGAMTWGVCLWNIRP